MLSALNWIEIIKDFLRAHYNHLPI